VRWEKSRGDGTCVEINTHRLSFRITYKVKDTEEKTWSGDAVKSFIIGLELIVYMNRTHCFP